MSTKVTVFHSNCWAFVQCFHHMSYFQNKYTIVQIWMLYLYKLKWFLKISFVYNINQLYIYLIPVFRPQNNSYEFTTYTQMEGANL